MTALRNHPAGFRPVTPADAPFAKWDPPSPTPDQVLAGKLDMAIAVIWQSDDRRQATGYWRCEPVRLHLVQLFEETLHLVKGCVSYAVAGHERITLLPGDSIVLTRGAEAIFEAHEPSITFWAIFADEALEF